MDRAFRLSRIAERLLKTLLRRSTGTLLRDVTFPQYVPIGLPEPQPLVDVFLEGRGDRMRVTSNNVVTALRPFTVGIMFDRSRAAARESDLQRLVFQERESGQRLGTIVLRPVRQIELPEHRFELFETPRCENHCLPALKIRLHHWYQDWKTARLQRRNPHNFRLTQQDMRANFTFYICPRPVVLVSVAHQAESNIFPMDLIGPTDSQWFSMALRSTSPAIRLMQESRRMALASIPLAYKDHAYALGAHHKLASIDWSRLPFETVESPAWGLRVPKAALRVREVRVQEFHVIGSHILFLTTTERETTYNSSVEGDSGQPMFHIAGSYWRRRVRANPEA